MTFPFSRKLTRLVAGSTLALGFILTQQSVRAVEPDAMVPPDSEFVMAARPRQLLESPFLKDQGWDILLKTKRNIWMAKSPCLKR